MTFKPRMPRSILVQHHANERPPRTLLAVCRALRRNPHITRSLQVHLGHRIAERIAVPLLQLLVEMLDREVGILVLKQTQHPLDLSLCRTLRRRLSKPPIRQPWRALIVEPVPPAAERPLVDPQHLGSFQLRNLTALLAVQ